MLSCQNLTIKILSNFIVHSSFYVKKLDLILKQFCQWIKFKNNFVMHHCGDWEMAKYEPPPLKLPGAIKEDNWAKIIRVFLIWKRLYPNFRQILNIYILWENNRNNFIISGISGCKLNPKSFLLGNTCQMSWKSILNH